ncbi:hypothetical protein AZF37_09545 [endosymbiont 'TC1' of Trimyema compressum]|nr:hypothetical protein AZF37_09545 [endosymbiont 'TC1' of Trimyema compressum]
MKASFLILTSILTLLPTDIASPDIPAVIDVLVFLRFTLAPDNTVKLSATVEIMDALFDVNDDVVVPIKVISLYPLTRTSFPLILF